MDVQAETSAPETETSAATPVSLQESAPAQDETAAAGRKKQPRDKRDKKVTPCPERPPVKVYKSRKEKDGNSVYVDANVKFRGDKDNKENRKSQSFQEIDNKRQASRNDFLKTLTQVAFKVKNVTNDDVFVAIKKSEKAVEGEEISCYTTDKNNFIYTQQNSNRSTSPKPHQSRPGVPSLQHQDARRLALSSPSTSRYVKRVDTARSVAKSNSKYCKGCGHKYRKSDDATDPWVGCFAWSEKKTVVPQRCDVWMHAACTGWFAKNEDEVAEMPDWYCKRHRKSVMVPRTTTKPAQKRKSAAKSSRKVKTPKK